MPEHYMTGATEKPATAADREAALAAKIASDSGLAADDRAAPKEHSPLAAAAWANWNRMARENAGNKQEEKRSWVTAVEIEESKMKEPKFAVPGLLPTGLSILAGRPKIG